MKRALVGCVLLGVLGAVITENSGGMSMSASAEARIYRVILPVGDMEKAQGFYARLLGQEGRRVSPNRHYFDCGGVILALVDPRGEGEGAVARPNQDHVYFAVADLKEYHRRATEVGGLSKEMGDGNLAMGKMETRPWGEVSFYMHDPFGNPLCFVDEKTVFTGK